FCVFQKLDTKSIPLDSQNRRLGVVAKLLGFWAVADGRYPVRSDIVDPGVGVKLTPARRWRCHIVWAESLFTRLTARHKMMPAPFPAPPGPDPGGVACPPRSVARTSACCSSPLLSSSPSAFRPTSPIHLC